MAKQKQKNLSLRMDLELQFKPSFKKFSQILIGINKTSKGDPNKTFKDLFSLLSDPIIHIQSLGNIKPNKGMSTAGIDNITLDGMNLKLIQSIADEFKNGTFQFSPTRRVYIPKPGTTKKRPLGIPIIKDRIVQESIRLILEAIYEPIFERLKDQNYGFRPNKSTHDAIMHIQRNGTACNAAIEGDIKGAYDNVNIDKLINILRKRIKDENFLKLIRQGCNSGMIDFGEYKDTLIGVPQGGIASPILFNIYMHEFDEYINHHLNKVLIRYNNLLKREDKIRNPEYRKLESRISYIKKQNTKIL